MTPRPLKHLLLLEQSGELSDRQQRVLDAELAQSAAAREMRRALHGLAAALPEPTTPPSPDAAAHIAARLAQTAPPAPHFRRPAQIILAAAAALALFLSIQTFRTHRSPTAAAPQLARVETEAAADHEWTDPLEDDFAELERLLLAISDNPFEFADL